MKICILDAWGAEDPALVNSHWVAERTAIALQSTFPGVSLAIMSGGVVDRACAEVVLAEDHDGFAYFGHGQEAVLYRHKDSTNPVVRPQDWPPIPIVEITHLASLGRRWFHAFACLSGHTLSKEAACAGTGAYLGYSIEVIVEWNPVSLPEELRQLLNELVVVGTLLLAAGERSRRSIRGRVRDASNRLLEWLDMHESSCQQIPWIELTGLKMLANGLHRKLELEGVEVLP